MTLIFERECGEMNIHVLCISFVYTTPLFPKRPHLIPIRAWQFFRVCVLFVNTKHNVQRFTLNLHRLKKASLVVMFYQTGELRYLAYCCYRQLLVLVFDFLVYSVAQFCVI